MKRREKSIYIYIYIKLASVAREEKSRNAEIRSPSGGERPPARVSAIAPEDE